jgi:magnesium-transporting ATPase (P-type)
MHTRRDQVFEIHAEFPFDSDRKRMSLLVEEKAHGLAKESRYILMSKGADSIMIPRCKFSSRIK